VDSTGLAFTITLPKTNVGDDTAENVRLQNLTGVSFGFETVDDSWAVDGEGNAVRTLLDVNLFEISITSFPAYQATSVSTRSAPAVIRQKLTRRDDDDGFGDCDEDVQDDEGNCPDDPDYDGDGDDDRSENENGCSCRCHRCENDSCFECVNAECDDENCAACPHQDDERADKLRIRTLFAHRALTR
jgi:hypothetical protein